MVGLSPLSFCFDPRLAAEPAYVPRPTATSFWLPSVTSISTTLRSFRLDELGGRGERGVNRWPQIVGAKVDGGDGAPT